MENGWLNVYKNVIIHRSVAKGGFFGMRGVEHISLIFLSFCIPATKRC